MSRAVCRGQCRSSDSTVREIDIRISTTSGRTTTTLTGTVRWFSYSKGCGYIIPDDGSQDIFAHSSELVDVESECLNPYQRVTYLLCTGPSGAVARQIRAAR
jgi:CspA family cold shock protein